MTSVRDRTREFHLTCQVILVLPHVLHRLCFWQICGHCSAPSTFPSAFADLGYKVPVYTGAAGRCKSVAGSDTDSDAQALFCERFFAFPYRFPFCTPSRTFCRLSISYFVNFASLNSCTDRQGCSPHCREAGQANKAGQEQVTV